MRLDGSVARCPPAFRAEPKSKSCKKFNGDEIKERKTGVKLPVRVTNLVSQKQLPDTLHSKANVILIVYALQDFFLKPMLVKQRSMCPFSTCFGSMMQNNVSNQANTRSKAEILSQAVKFMEEYYLHQKK